VTLIWPLDVPPNTWIEVPEVVPLQPEGSVHTYDVAPLTGAMLYVRSEFVQAVSLPLITPGLARLEMMLTARFAVELAGPQPFSVRTRSVPEVVILVILIEGVAVVSVLPDAELLQPAGIVQMYELAPPMVLAVNVWFAPAQTNACPLIEVAAAGAVPAMMLRELAIEVPQGEVAVTEMVPGVPFGVTSIELVVEVPDQPVGRVQA
jgi:hypothetical protein